MRTCLLLVVTAAAFTGACGSDAADAVTSCVRQPQAESGIGVVDASPTADDCEQAGVPASGCDSTKFISVDQAFCALGAQQDVGQPIRATLTFVSTKKRAVWGFAYPKSATRFALYLIDAITGDYLGESEECATATDCG